MRIARQMSSVAPLLHKKSMSRRRSSSTSGMMRMEMMTLASPNWTAALRARVSSLPVSSANFT